MLRREAHVGQHVCLGLIHQRRELRDARPGLVCDLAPLLSRRRRVVLGEGGADPGRDDAPLCLAGIGKRVAHKVYAAALPGCPQNLDDGGLQPFVRVRDHQLRPAQAATCQAAQELDPERLGLAVAERHAEHLAPTIVLTSTATMTATETMWWSRRALT